MTDESKKDLTSLVELSALELAKLGHNAADGHGGVPGLEMPVIEKITEADFGDLEALSKQAAEEAAKNPQAAEPAPEPAPEAKSEPAMSAAPALEAPPPEAPTSTSAADGPMIAAVESPPGESAVAPGLGLTGLEGLSADPSAAPTDGFSLPSISQIGTGLPEAPAEGTALPESTAAASASPDGMPAMAVNETEPSAAPTSALNAFDTQSSIAAPASEAPAAETPAPELPSEQPSEGAATVESFGAEPAHHGAAAAAAPDAGPKSEPKSRLDPDRPAVNAPPAGADRAIKGKTPDANKTHDLTQLKAFADKISIGKPRLEGAPPFSILVRSPTGQFDKKTIEAIENAITSEDFGIRVDDIAIQLTAGKLLVPQISEFAAVTLAQKLRDVVESIEVDLAPEIFKSATVSDDGDDPMLLDAEEFESHREEVHDVGAEPRSADDLFSSNLAEVREFQVTRILSIVMTTEIIAAEIAEKPTTKEFETTIERLTEDLIQRAFKLGAHGVLGVSFNLRPIDAYRDAEGKISRAYRLIGNGTAVRVRRRHVQDAPETQD